MEVSLKEQLTRLFPTDEGKVKALLQLYWDLVKTNPSWRIGGFIAMLKEAV